MVQASGPVYGGTMLIENCDIIRLDDQEGLTTMVLHDHQTGMIYKAITQRNRIKNLMRSFIKQVLEDRKEGISIIVR